MLHTPGTALTAGGLCFQPLSSRIPGKWSVPWLRPEGRPRAVGVMRTMFKAARTRRTSSYKALLIHSSRNLHVVPAGPHFTDVDTEAQEALNSHPAKNRARNSRLVPPTAGQWPCLCSAFFALRNKASLFLPVFLFRSVEGVLPVFADVPSWYFRASPGPWPLGVSASLSWR